MERRHTTQPTAIETRADGKRYISGHGIVFYREGDKSTEFELWNDKEGRAVERVATGFADRALMEKHDVRGLFNHDSNHLLGRVGSGTMTLTKDANGIRYDIPYDENDPDHKSVAAKMERGDLNGSSFAFTASARWEREADGTEVRWLTDGDLFDMGPVTYPAYGGTTAGMRAGGDIADIRAERETWATRNKDRERMQREMQSFVLEE